MKICRLFGSLSVPVAVLAVSLVGCKSAEDSASETTDVFLEQHEQTSAEGVDSISIAPRQTGGDRSGDSGNRSEAIAARRPADAPLTATSPKSHETQIRKQPDRSIPQVPDQPKQPTPTSPPEDETQPHPADGHTAASADPEEPSAPTRGALQGQGPSTSVELTGPKIDELPTRTAKTSPLLPVEHSSNGTEKSDSKPIPIRIPQSSDTSPSDRKVAGINDDAWKRLSAMQLPPPVKRLEALKALREHGRNRFIVRFDARAPQLLTRIEAIVALEVSDTARVILLPLTLEEADLWIDWIDDGRRIRLPQSWAASLQQSPGSRSARNDRRHADLQRVRAERNDLKDKLYRFLLGDGDSPSN